MADRPRGGGSGSPHEDPPDYDWLYGTKNRGEGSSAQRPPDPEPTRMMPTLNRPSSPRDTPGSGGGDRTGPATTPRPQPPQPPSQQPPSPPRSPKKRRRFGWVKVALLLWLVFLVAVPAWAWTKIAKVDAEPGGSRPDSQPGSTYLLVGSDSREDLSAAERQELGTGKAEGRRTDTIMLLHTGSGPNLLLSVPRDSIVDVPGYGSTKINAAYAFGGPQLLVKTLENETGIRIDNYVEIGLGGFVSVIDAVGGIEICPKESMKDPLAKLDVEKGCQDADGKTALGYARSRKLSSLGDIDRARRQREVVSAVGSKAASPWSILNPVRYVRLSSAGADSVAVGEDTGPIDTARFAWAMTRVNGENGLTCSVPIADLAVNWDRERALEMFRLIKEDRTADIPPDLCSASGLRDQ
ncbi:MAG TPA: LCP family protein [Nocardioidaceae bacterium]|nr:LCP family protein [Nocardioidaceae bacterium]